MAATVRRETVPPQGVVTFLLTDVEGSSRRWERDPGTMAEAMALHDHVITETIDGHGGFRPPEQGEGDSVVSVFSHATHAVACALELQQRLRAAPWPAAAELRVRMALHTGEASPLPDGRYQGAAIVRCARLRDLAAGGQTLLSRSTDELVAERLPPGADLRRLGSYQLRDLARPEEVFELVHPDLPAGPAPPGALDRPAHNLPSPLSRFIGRGPELDEVGQLLDAHRIVTLTGAGGAGKTRLAREVAASRLDAHADGAGWVDLAPVAHPGLVGAALAGALAVREVLGQALLDTVVEQLRDRQLLLVLDNCEHLIGEVATLADSLARACPGVVLLSTSREPIGVEGEIVYRVPSMTVPDAAQALESGRSCDAVALFVDRARAADPAFELDRSSWPAMVSICTRLDGLPLALELAAARTRALSLDQIADGLAGSFSLIAGGSHTALPRQQTLRQSIAWSYDLLDESERAVLLRLSVFAGGFDIDAAASVCSGDGLDASEVVEVLTRLTDKSLVHVDRSARGNQRHRLLETVRHFAEERLPAADHEPSTRDRHLEHYLQLAETAAPELERHDQLAWLDRLRIEHDNLRTAADWSRLRGDGDRELRLATALWLFWTYRGHLTEAQSRLQAALSAPDADPATRGRALLALADTMLLQGGFASLGEPLSEALTLARAASDRRLETAALTDLAWAELMTGDPKALGTFQDAVAAAREGEDDLWQSYALIGLGYLHCFAGSMGAARGVLEQAHELATGCGNRKAIAMAANWLGFVLAETGELGAARRTLAGGSRAAEELGDPLIWSQVLMLRSRCEALMGDLDAAGATASDASAIAHRSRNPLAIATTDVSAAWLHAGRGELPTGEDWLAKIADALGFARLLALEHFVGLFQWIQGDATLAAGDRAGATACWSEVAQRARAQGNPMYLGQACRGLALVAWLDGDAEMAERHAHVGLAELREAGLWPTVVDLLEILAAAWADLGATQRAARLLGAAEADRTGRGHPRSPALEGHLARGLGTLRSDDLAPDREAGAAMGLEDAVAYATRGRGRRDRPATGWASLTPAEQEVVALVTEGLTNPQVGERMFISRRTVQAHLGRVFTKLGVSSRTELAAEAIRRSAELAE